MIMISGVEIVKIESKSSLYKEGVEARGIEVCHFSFLKTRELSGWSIVVQKGLYGVGDLAIYIQPDYCLSWLSIFSDFWAPGGDEKKSRLGKGAGLELSSLISL